MRQSVRSPEVGAEPVARGERRIDVRRIHVTGPRGEQIAVVPGNAKRVPVRLSGNRPASAVLAGCVIRLAIS